MVAPRGGSRIYKRGGLTQGMHAGTRGSGGMPPQKNRC